MTEKWVWEKNPVPCNERFSPGRNLCKSGAQKSQETILKIEVF